MRLEASIDATFNAYRAELDGSPVDDNVIAEVLRSSADGPTPVAPRGRHPRRSGAQVAERVRRLAHLRNEAARELGFRDHFAMALDHRRAGRGRLARHPRRDRPRDGGAVPGLEGAHRPRRGPSASRITSERAAALALRRPVLPERTGRGGPRARRLARRPRSGRAHPRRPTAGSASTSTRSSTRSDLVPRDGKSQHAFCINIDRASRRPGAVQQRARRVLDRDDAPRVRSRRLRRRPRPLAPLVPADDASPHDRGSGDALRSADPRPGVAARGRRSARADVVADAAPALARAGGSWPCSSSRGGCS